MKNKIYTDLMVDIETLDNSPTSIVLSIGAVPFNMNGEMSDNVFHQYINIDSCASAGLTLKQSTFLWWLNQSEEARNTQITAERKSLEKVLSAFSGYYQDLLHPYIWGNGAAFDIAILRNAYNAVHLDIPWLPWYEQDCRTIVRLNKQIKQTQEFKGVQHDALDDCRHQIRYICNTVKASVKDDIYAYLTK